MTPGQRMTLLVQGIAQDRQDYVRLQQQLETQRVLLLARDIAQLTAINQQLMDIYQALSQRAAERQSQLRALNVSADKQGLFSLFRRLPPEKLTKVSALWEDLEQQTRRCQQLNERNGMVLHMQQDIMENIVNADRPDAFLY